MSEYDNTNRFTLFVNDKQGNDKRPDRTGTLNVEGVEYFIDGWIKTSKSGQTFLSGSIKRKDKQSAAPAQAAPKRHGDRPGAPPQARSGTGFDDMDSDLIPF